MWQLALRALPLIAKVAKNPMTKGFAAGSMIGGNRGNNFSQGQGDGQNGVNMEGKNFPSSL